MPEMGGSTGQFFVSHTISSGRVSKVTHGQSIWKSESNLEDRIPVLIYTRTRVVIWNAVAGSPSF